MIDESDIIPQNDSHELDDQHKFISVIKEANSSHNIAKCLFKADGHVRPYSYTRVCSDSLIYTLHVCRG